MRNSSDHPGFDENETLDAPWSGIPGWRFWAVWGVGFVLSLGAFAATVGWMAANNVAEGPVGALAQALGAITAALVVGAVFAVVRKLRFPTAPERLRYFMRFSFCLVAYYLVLVASLLVSAMIEPSGVVAWSLALLPAAPLAALGLVIGAYLRREPDEFVRRSHLEVLLWSTGATLLIASVWDSLQMSDLVSDYPFGSLVTLWVVIYLAAKALVWRKYQ